MINKERVGVCIVLVIMKSNWLEMESCFQFINNSLKENDFNILFDLIKIHTKR